MGKILEIQSGVSILFPYLNDFQIIMLLIIVFQICANIHNGAIICNMILQHLARSFGPHSVYVSEYENYLTDKEQVFITP